MQIFRELAGYSLGRADLVRRAMSKKKHDVMQKEREIFLHGQLDETGRVTVEGCVRRGISEETANRIFDEMSSFASYAFNKSHAAAYALVAYRTAWLKCHYPGEYMAALLTSSMDGGRLPAYMAECEKLHLPVQPPSVNESEDGFSFCGGDIRFGLLAIRNLGRTLSQAIRRDRAENGAFPSFYAFCRRLSAYRECNRRALESLIKAGALDGLGATRAQMLSVLPKLLAQLSDSARGDVSGQIGFFDDAAMGEDDYPLPDLPEYTLSERLAMEKEVTGMYLTGHPMAPYRDCYRTLHAVNTETLLRLRDEPSSRYTDGADVCLLGLVGSLKQKATKSGATMAYVQLEDLTGSIEMVVFPRQMAQAASLLREGEKLIVQGKLSLRDEELPRVTAEKIRLAPPPEQLTASADALPAPVPPSAPRAAAGLPPAVRPDPPAEAAAKTETTAKSAHRGLYLKIPSLQSREWKRALLVLDIFTGSEPLFLRCEDTGKLVRSSTRFGVWPDPVLLQELVRILGGNNVRWIE